MSSKKLIELKINGENYDATVSGSETLLTLLRDQLDLTGTKRGCNQGVCGACTVIKDGVPVRSCLTLAGFCNSSEVTTVEGLAIDRNLSNLQNAFSENGAVQCGFCISGMLITIKALLDKVPNPTIDEVREAISGNLCRCSGYKKIIDATLEASRSLNSEELA